MSDFVCSQCGTNYIDCDGVGYKTPKEIELEKENEKLKKRITELKVRLLDAREARDNATKVANTYLDQNDDFSKTIERLQEQLNEANDVLIKSQNMQQPDRNNYVAQYLLKWGVK